MAALEEAQSLKGNVLFHPSMTTPHAYPSFLRAAVCRIVAGSMLLSGVFTAICSITAPSTEGQFSCAMATAVNMVAFYHYMKLTAIREQTATRLTLAKPGDVPMGQATELKIAWLDMAADAVRYSDWAVTLPGLLIELHLLIPDVDPKFFGIPWSCVLIVAVVLLGAYTRFGTDELVPIAKTQRNSLADGFARISGLVAFVLASVALFLILYNLLANINDATDPTNGWIFVFSLSWVAYGVVALIAIVVRQFWSDAGYPETLSVFKDCSYGALDILAKAVFGIYVGCYVLGKTDPVFAL